MSIQHLSLEQWCENNDISTQIVQHSINTIRKNKNLIDKKYDFMVSEIKFITSKDFYFYFVLDYNFDDLISININNKNYDLNCGQFSLVVSHFFYEEISNLIKGSYEKDKLAYPSNILAKMYPYYNEELESYALNSTLIYNIADFENYKYTNFDFDSLFMFIKDKTFIHKDLLCIL